MLLCISKILKNESNSQLLDVLDGKQDGCCVSQRYWKMKAIHNYYRDIKSTDTVVVYLKDTEKWKQFTTVISSYSLVRLLLCISKILKNESNSQPHPILELLTLCCCVSQRYWKKKAIHNLALKDNLKFSVVVYLKDTEKWKQFTTMAHWCKEIWKLLCISKILKNESNSQLRMILSKQKLCCCVSQRYWKMKAIHNYL